MKKINSFPPPVEQPQTTTPSILATHRAKISETRALVQQVEDLITESAKNLTVEYSDPAEVAMLKALLPTSTYQESDGKLYVGIEGYKYMIREQMAIIKYKKVA